MLNNFNRISTDKLRTDVILAKKVLWCSEGVSNAENLLSNEVQQAPANDNNQTVFSTTQGRSAAILLDFGCEFAGGVQIVAGTGAVRTGGRFKIRFGESAAEAMTPFGEKEHSVDHSRTDMDVILPYNSCSRYGNTGYRFLYLELIEPESSFLIIAVHGLVCYRDIPYLGSFQCDDMIMNQIYNTCAYTVHMNIQEKLWDGIKRDRMVWVGDVHPEMLAIRSVFGEIEEIADVLRTVPKQNPLPQWPNSMTAYAAWYIRNLWDWYFYTGSYDLVDELKYYWKELLEQILKLVHENQDEVLNEDEFNRGFFLDWPTRYTTDAKAGMYALFSLALRAGEGLCNVAGETTLAVQCHHKREILDKNSIFKPEKKQTAAMMQLAGQIDNQISKEILTEGLGRGMSTFMSVYILKAVRNAGDMTTAIQMLREYYGAMLEVGATTFWEDFDLDWVRKGAHLENLPGKDCYDIHGDNGRFCYEQFRHSLCHGWSGGPVAFFAEDILGIEILEAGCKKIAIHPNLGTLSWAKGTYPTPYGLITVFVKMDGEHMTVDVDAPDEISVSLSTL